LIAQNCLALISPAQRWLQPAFLILPKKVAFIGTPYVPVGPYKSDYFTPDSMHYSYQYYRTSGRLSLISYFPIIRIYLVAGHTYITIYCVLYTKEKTILTFRLRQFYDLRLPFVTKITTPFLSYLEFFPEYFSRTNSEITDNWAR